MVFCILVVLLYVIYFVFLGVGMFGLFMSEGFVWFMDLLTFE